MASPFGSNFMNVIGALEYVRQQREQQQGQQGLQAMQLLSKQGTFSPVPQGETSFAGNLLGLLPQNQYKVGGNVLKFEPHQTIDPATLEGLFPGAGAIFGSKPIRMADDDLLKFLAQAQKDKSLAAAMQLGFAPLPSDEVGIPQPSLASGVPPTVTETNLPPRTPQSPMAAPTTTRERPPVRPTEFGLQVPGLAPAGQAQVNQSIEQYFQDGDQEALTSRLSTVIPPEKASRLTVGIVRAKNGGQVFNPGLGAQSGAVAPTPSVPDNLGLRREAIKLDQDIAALTQRRNVMAGTGSGDPRIMAGINNLTTQIAQKTSDRNRLLQQLREPGQKVTEQAAMLPGKLAETQGEATIRADVDIEKDRIRDPERTAEEVRKQSLLIDPRVEEATLKAESEARIKSEAERRKPIGKEGLEYVHKDTLNTPPPSMSMGDVQESGDYVVIAKGEQGRLRANKRSAEAAIKSFNTLAGLMDSAPDLFPTEGVGNYLYAQGLGKAPSFVQKAENRQAFATMAALRANVPNLVKAFGDVGNIALNEREIVEAAQGLKPDYRSNVETRLRTLNDLLIAPLNNYFKDLGLNVQLPSVSTGGGGQGGSTGKAPPKVIGIERVQ